jgi:aryl-alcohol dehydrogenase-like predicted oxidoreductase
MAESRLRKIVGGRLRVGLGGEGILRTEGHRKEALAMLDAAYGAGIRYYDSAPAYAGSEEYLGTFFGMHPERKADTFQTSKSARRDAKGAEGELTRTLARLGRDHLGLWQIHDIRTREDVRRIEDPGGALEAFYAARESGTVRGIGVTGHHDPAVLLHAVTNWDVDAVLLPVNPVEMIVGGFIDRVIPAARERGIGVIGMKTLGAGNYISPESGLAAETLVRFALSQDIDIVIVGCSTPEEAGSLAQAGATHTLMETEEQERVMGPFRPFAERMAFYRGVT